MARAYLGAPRVCNAHIVIFLVVIYKKRKGNDHLLVGIYVHDLLITRAGEDEIGKLKLQMKELFKMSYLGLLRYYLGIELHQKPEGVTLCQ